MSYTKSVHGLTTVVEVVLAMTPWSVSTGLTVVTSFPSFGMSEVSSEENFISAQFYRATKMRHFNLRYKVHLPSSNGDYVATFMVKVHLNLKILLKVASLYFCPYGWVKQFIRLKFWKTPHLSSPPTATGALDRTIGRAKAESTIPENIKHQGRVII